MGIEVFSYIYSVLVNHRYKNKGMEVKLSEKFLLDLFFFFYKKRTGFPQILKSTDCHSAIDVHQSQQTDIIK